MRSLPIPIYPLLLGLALLGLPAALVAQVSWSARASATVIAINENITVTYSLQQATSDSFVPPSLDQDWFIVKGPLAKTTILEEQGTRTVVKDFQYVLRPRAVGSIQVPAAGIRWQGKLLQSNSLGIDVLQSPEKAAIARHENGPATAADFTYDGYVAEPGEDLLAKTRQQAFLRIRLSKQQVYEGEPLVAEYLLYSRLSLEAQVARRPGFAGFSSIDLVPDSLGSFHMERIQGKVYKVFVVRKVQLYPLAPGPQRLQPFEVEVKANYRKVPTAGRLEDFDQYSPDNVVEIATTLRSDEPLITVRALPNDRRPDSFSGLVGRFQLSAGISAPQAGLQQPFTFTLTAEGLGMWSMMPPPRISWPAGVAAGSPQVSELIDSQHVPVQGERTWTYSLQASATGTLTLPAVSLSYFDPWKGHYVTTTSLPQTIQITAASGSATGSAYAPEADQLYPSEGMALTDWFTRYMPLVLLGGVLLLIGTLLWQRRKRQMQDRQAAEEHPWPYDDGIIDAATTTPPEAWQPGPAAATPGQPPPATELPLLKAWLLAQQASHSHRWKAKQQQAFAHALNLCEQQQFAPPWEKMPDEELQQALEPWLQQLQAPA